MFLTVKEVDTSKNEIQDPLFLPDRVNRTITPGIQKPAVEQEFSFNPQPPYKSEDDSAIIRSTTHTNDITKQQKRATLDDQLTNLHVHCFS